MSLYPAPILELSLAGTCRPGGTNRERRLVMRAVVKDVMSTRPVSVTADASFKELVGLLSELDVSAFPVVDADGRVLGVVSQGDLLAKEAMQDESHGWLEKTAVMAHRSERRKASGATAGELMTSPAVTVSAEDTAEHAAAVLYGHGLRQLPVVDAERRLVGIIGRVDVLAVFDRRDADIREEIMSEVIPRLSEPSWYSVQVKDGIVTVEGTPETIPIGHQVLARIRHVQGVVAVRDRLVYPVPPEVAAPWPYFARDRYVRRAR